MLARLCLCGVVEPLALATRVLVVGTPREERQNTNTGRLVPLALANAALCTRDPARGLAQLEELDDPGRRVLLLFPAADAPELAPDARDPRPVTLVVADATWRQARKLVRREPRLAALPRACLPAGAPSHYRLRSHPEAGNLATFEAVARALGILEGAEVRARLERVFAQFVERTLWSRGQLRGVHVTGGVPGPLGGDP